MIAAECEDNVTASTDSAYGAENQTFFIDEVSWTDEENYSGIGDHDDSTEEEVTHQEDVRKGINNTTHREENPLEISGEI